MSHDLSDDLIVEIFLRLPIKTLIRFTSVSKSLRSCISSPNFIRLHSLRSPNKLTIIHRTRYKGESCNKLIYTSHSEDQLLCNPYIRITPVEYPFTSIRIVGSCNGVLCVYETGNGYNLWNPSIRRKVTIPDLPSSSDCLVHGFGFDPIIDSYKILRISKPGSFVYTVKTRAWRQIGSPSIRFSDVNSAQCVFNGALHWIVKITDLLDVCRYCYVMAFDLSTEVFSTIVLPEPSWETNVVTIIKGCLAVISSKCGNSMIWVRRECNNTAATAAAVWSVAFKFNRNPFDGAKRVYQRAIDGYLVINNSKGIRVFNPEERIRVIWELQKLRRSSLIVEMNMCVESLGLLDMGTSCDQGSKSPVKKEELEQVKLDKGVNIDTTRNS